MNDVIIIGGNHHNTLGVIRALGEKGFRPILIAVTAEKRPFVSYCKYLKQVIQIADDGKIPSVLMGRCGSCEEKDVVICCSDASSSMIDENRCRLSENYILPGTEEQGRVTFLMNKKEMACLAVETGMKVPLTCYGDSLNNEGGIPLPCIIKPLVSMKGQKNDIKICRTFHEAREWVMYIGKEDVQIQEFLDKDFEYQLIGCSTGKDVVIPGISRILRPCKGSNTSFLHYEPLTTGFCDIERCREYVRRTGYRGLFSLEFLRDRQGNDYFLEMNFRNDGNAICVTEAGVNLPYIWYLTCMGQDYRGEMNKPIKASYVMPDCAELKLLLTGQISLREYMKDLRKTDRFMEYDRQDPKPFWRMVRAKLHLW